MDDCIKETISEKPKKWNHIIENLSQVPVNGKLGQFFRLKMLSDWSNLPMPKKRRNIPVTSPRTFANIDVSSMEPSEVYEWCLWLGIKFDNESHSRKKLKKRLELGEREIDYYVDIRKMNEKPYKCSKPDTLRMAIAHTSSIDPDWDNIYDMLGKDCPESTCNGKIVPNYIEQR